MVFQLSNVSATFAILALLWKISMSNIDEILAGAIRTTWLQVNGPESGLPHHIEMVIARRIRAALEREGVIVTPSRRMHGAGASIGNNENRHPRHA
jgi:hypothetical protein